MAAKLVLNRLRLGGNVIGKRYRQEVEIEKIQLLYSAVRIKLASHYYTEAVILTMT